MSSAKKNLCLVIFAHQCFVRHIEDAKDHGLENDILFSSISNVYLPLLNALRLFENEERDWKISLAFSPVLCSLLSDSAVCQEYVDWLDRKIAFGKSETERLKNSEHFENAKRTFEKAKKDKIDFTEVYESNLVKEILRLSEKGRIELLATCATCAYLPHYFDLPEVVSAQIEAGLLSHKKYFGMLPDGFFLPYLGYTPGVEKILRSFGMNYTLIDSRSLFFSPDIAKKGIFVPVRAESPNPLSLFACDGEVSKEIENLKKNDVFKSVQRDAGYELSQESLADFLCGEYSRIPTGFRYFANSGKPYDFEKAQETAKKAAQDFVSSRQKRLCEASEEIGEDSTLVCAFDARSLGKDFEEGSIYFEEILRTAIFDDSIRLCACSDVIYAAEASRTELQRVRIYPSANTGDGFAENLLDNSNSYLLRYARKMSERMIDISDRFPRDTGLKIRLLNLGARELLLSQDSEWARIINADEEMKDYAAAAFKEFIRSFIVVYDSLGSNTVSTEWLTSIERKHNIFPWLNFRIFLPKK